MTRRFGRKSRSPRDRTDDVSLYLDRGRRGRRGRQLRIERTGNTICALSGEGGRRVEQPEIARVGHMDETVLHLLDGPRQQLVQRARRLKIEAGELAPEGSEIQVWGDRAF